MTAFAADGQPGWWTELGERRRAVELDEWAADRLRPRQAERAERVARCRVIANELWVRANVALETDERERGWRRRHPEYRSGRSDRFLRSEVNYAAGGRVLGVR